MDDQVTNDWTKIEQVRLVIALGIFAGLIALIQFWTNPSNTVRELIGQFVPELSTGPVVEAQAISVLLVLFAFGFYMAFMLFGTIFDSRGGGLRKVARGFYASGAVLILVIGILEALRILLY